MEERDHLDKPRMRRCGAVWVASHRGYQAQAVCPVWAYSSVLEKVRTGGWNHFD